MSEHTVEFVTVTHDRVKYTVDVNQDLADVIDDLIQELYEVTPDGPYEYIAELADKLGQRAINTPRTSTSFTPEQQHVLDAENAAVVRAER